MESVATSKIIEKCLQQIKNLPSSSSNDFVKDMQELLDIIKLKESKNISKIVSKLLTKLHRRKLTEETIEKEFHEMIDYFTRELAFKDDIILENCSLIIQQQRKHCELMSKKKSAHNHQISLNENQLKFNKEKLEKIITSKTQSFERARLDHMQAEKTKRSEWLATKATLNDTLLRYDTEMMEQQNELEFIQNIKDSEEKDLENYKKTCASQETTYYQLMKEKEDYLEEERQRKLYEIRLKFAKRTIVKFIEQHYPAWKKRKLRASKKKGKYKYGSKSVK